MGPRCSSAETQVCHRSYIIAARVASENQKQKQKQKKHAGKLYDRKSMTIKYSHN